MSKKGTINTLQLLQAHFAQKIAEVEMQQRPNDNRNVKIYVPLYEATSAFLVAAKDLWGTEYNGSLENRTALTMVKKHIQSIVLYVKTINDMFGDLPGWEISDTPEILRDADILLNIANDILA